jgi:hypothetical protein
MPTLTGLPALIKRAKVLAGSAVARLTTVASALIVFAQSLDGVGGIPAWVPKLAVSLAVLITSVVFQVRRVTPVDDSDKGLLPPKGPAVPAGDAADRGLGMIEVIVIIVAVAVAVVLIAIKVY